MVCDVLRRKAKARRSIDFTTLMVRLVVMEPEVVFLSVTDCEYPNTWNFDIDAIFCRKFVQRSAL
jgi:hypothetical protein